jgi:hypothetical protein
MRFTRSFSHASDNERGPSPSATISKPLVIVRRLERSNPFPSWIKQADCIRTVSLPCHKHRVGGPGEPPVARNPIVGSLGAHRLGGGAATLSAVHDRLAAVVACNAHLGIEVVDVGPGRGVRVPEWRYLKNHVSMLGRAGRRATLVERLDTHGGFPRVDRGPRGLDTAS